MQHKDQQIADQTQAPAVELEPIEHQIRAAAARAGSSVDARRTSSNAIFFSGISPDGTDALIVKAIDDAKIRTRR